MTSQGSAYARFRRAIDSHNPTVALATATELDFVSLPDALELVLLLVDDPKRFRRAALRWHARYCAEVRPLRVCRWARQALDRRWAKFDAVADERTLCGGPLARGIL